MARTYDAGGGAVAEERLVDVPGAMTFPEEELPDVADAARIVREEALGWAATIAAACRCAQGVFELLPEPAA